MNGKLILAVLLSDALETEGPVVITAINQVGAARGDPFKLAAAWVQFQGAVVGALPSLEADVSEQIATALTAKIQDAINKAQAATTAAATPAPAASAAKSA